MTVVDKTFLRWNETISNITVTCMCGWEKFVHHIIGGGNIFQNRGLLKAFEVT